MRKNVLCVSALLAVSFITQQASAQSWNVTGNAASSSNFLGTTNSVPLRLYTKGVERLRIDTLGNVGIGTTAPAAKLHIVDGVNTGGGYYKPLRIYNPNLLTGEHVQLAFGRASSSYNQGEVNFNLAGGVGSVNNTLSFGLYGNPTILTLQGTGSVGIGTAAPDGSAVLDMRSTTKGLLIPHMTTAQRNAITAPASGLLIYQTDGVPGFYYYNAGWLPLAGTSSSTGANTALSNLSATAINTDLLPGTNGTLNIGSASNSWNNIDYSGTIYKGGVSFISTVGTSNLFLGLSSGSAAVSGFYNAGLGLSALKNISSGYYNTAVGQQAMFSVTSGFKNSALGLNALYFNITGNDNTAIGNESLKNNTSSYNTAIGSFSLTSNQTGFGNTANGFETLRLNSDGSYNVAISLQTLTNNTTGSNNIGIGYHALYNNTVNSFNTAVGDNAGYNNASNSTFLGANAGSNSDITNVTAIGYNTVATADNQVRVGNTAVTSIGGQVGWTAFSDGRYKKNINEDVPGLEFINKLRPVTYNLDVDGMDRAMKTTASRRSEINSLGMRENGLQPSAAEIKAKLEKSKIKYTGFVAQEVEQAAGKLGYDFSGVDKPKSSKDFYGLRYSEFVVPLVKAVQELSKKNEELTKKAERVDELEARLAKLEALIGGSNTNISSTTFTKAYLEQNTPNPSDGSTTIRYHLPSNVSNAKLMITDMMGHVVKTIAIGSKGNGQVSLNAGSIASGSYTYTLYVEGQQTDSKQMIIAR